MTPGPASPYIPPVRFPALLCLLAVAGTIPFARAAHDVVFEDGRVLRVETLEFSEGEASLTLETGLVLRVPATSVVGLEPARDLPDPEDPIPVEEVRRVAEDLRDPDAWRGAAGRFADAIQASADRNGLDPSLLAAVARVESNFDPFAVSPKGACGILQLMPKTAQRFGVRNVFDAGQNVEGGARYLRFLLDRFDGDVTLALAGYNAGEGAVERHGGVPPYRETREYVDRVLVRSRAP